MCAPPAPNATGGRREASGGLASSPYSLRNSKLRWLSPTNCLLVRIGGAESLVVDAADRAGRHVGAGESRGSQHGRRHCKGIGVSVVMRSTVSRCRDSSAGSVRECAAHTSPLRAASSEAVEVGILCWERLAGWRAPGGADCADQLNIR